MAISTSLEGRPPHGATPQLLVALACFAAGWLVLPLAPLPSDALALAPAAGIALAGVMVYGAAVAPAVALGHFGVFWLQAMHEPALAPSGWFALAALALLSALQALATAALFRRWCGQPVTLARPREVLLLFAAGTLACAGTVAAETAVLLHARLLANDDVLHHAALSGLGELLGIMVATPVALSAIGRPREAWAARRRSVGLTLTLAMLLYALAVKQVTQWNAERSANAFQRDAAGASVALAAQFQQPLLALQAVHSVFLASTEVDRREMRLAATAWVKSGQLQAMGWIEAVRPDAVAAFEARQRSDGATDFRVHDRPEAPARPGGAPKFVIRFVEPVAGNVGALGIDVMSAKEAGPAVEAAVRSGLPVATTGFRLSQALPGDPSLGAVVYQAAYVESGAGGEDRSASLRGLVFVALRMQTQLDRASSQFSPYLRVCMVDVTDAAPARLAGPPDCELASPALLHVRPVAFGGRQWQVRVSAEPADVPDVRSEDVTLFVLVGFLAMAMLSGFLLTVTGRAHRVESAVRERTAELEDQVREREVAEAALRESEQRFRSILDNVPIGMFYSDLGGTMIQTNRSLCELTGYAEAELLCMRPSDYTHPDDLPEDDRLMAQLVDGEVAQVRHHKRFVSKAGEVLWVRTTASLLRDASGAARRIVGVVEDITELLRLEEAEQAREVAESSNRAKSEFLSRMSHELRTPLNAMLGFAQLLDLDQRHPLAPAQRPWIRQIQQAGWHLLEMINDVLDLSRIESGNLRLQTAPLRLADVVAESLSMIAGDAGRRRIAVTQNLASDAGVVQADATRLRQILVNLLTNAVKYNDEGGRIHVASRVNSAQMVEVSVTDTGLGMTAEQLAQLFQPFNRLGRERSAQEGTGIGLVISQRLAELMGGSLRARSTAGDGSTFTLTLPAVLDADTVRSDLHPLETGPANYHRRIVHYVEDNETNVEVMRGILSQRPQVLMEVSITGLDTLAALRTRRPDLILLDMHLPDISGLELLRHIKSDPDTSGIPVIVVSADALTRQIEAAFEAGAAHYLTKPVSVAELLAVVDQLLQRAETRFG